MSDKPKLGQSPREFWLDPDGAWYGFDEKIPNATHVIEHSAYDELKQAFHQALKQRNEALKKADKLAEALEKCLSQDFTFGEDGLVPYQRIIIKALKEYRGENNGK